jgi:hypothetical protein
MPDPAPIDILLDILELIERIERQTAGLTREASYRTQTPGCNGIPLSGDRRGGQGSR